MHAFATLSVSLQIELKKPKLATNHHRLGVAHSLVDTENLVYKSEIYVGASNQALTTIWDTKTDWTLI